MTRAVDVYIENQAILNKLDFLNNYYCSAIELEMVNAALKVCYDSIKGMLD